MENNFLSTTSSTKWDELAEKVLQGDKTLQTAKEFLQLENADKRSDALVAKFNKDPAGMTSGERAELTSYLMVFASEMQAQYGEAVTKELITGMLTGQDYLKSAPQTEAQQKAQIIMNTWGYHKSNASIGDPILAFGTGPLANSLKAGVLTNAAIGVGANAAVQLGGKDPFNYVDAILAGVTAAVTTGKGIGASTGINIEVITVKASLSTREAINSAGTADVLFCCVDSFEGRQMCDRVAAAFLQPLFDVAVTIPTRQIESGITIGDVCGRLDYVKPGGSTLADRGVYTPETLRREYLQKVAPYELDEQVAEGYIKGIADEAPSVITLNMRAASDCVMEFIARAYPFRHDPNNKRARSIFSLAAGEEDFISESDFERAPNPHLGRGLIEPLMGMPRFNSREV